MTLKTTLAAPFYHSRAQKLGKSELIYYYAYDRRWMEKEEVDLIIKRGIDQGLLAIDGEMYYPVFDLTEVSIPIGYKPSSAVFLVDDPFDQLLDRIITTTGKGTEEIIGSMNKIISDNFDSNLRPEAALVLIASQLQVEVSDLIEPLKQGLMKKE